MDVSDGDRCSGEAEERRGGIPAPSARESGVKTHCMEQEGGQEFPLSVGAHFVDCALPSIDETSNAHKSLAINVQQCLSVVELIL